jgi:hypothetical protein
MGTACQMVPPNVWLKTPKPGGRTSQQESGRGGDRTVDEIGHGCDGFIPFVIDPGW